MMIVFHKPSTKGLCDIKGENVINLMPGVNDISREQWLEIRQHPTVKQLIEDGDITEPDMDDADESGDDISLAIKDLQPKAAISLVKECVDLAVLEKWAAVEKRPKVVEALNEQMTVLRAPTKRRSDKADEANKA